MTSELAERLARLEDLEDLEAIRGLDARYRDRDLDWRYQREQVIFDYFSPLRDGWGLGRFSLPAAAATHRSTTAARES